MFNFERLSVWQKAIDYADAVYEATDRFPDRERFGLSNQLRRAAVSLSSNIAEGSSRSSSADYARFLEIAYGSLMETVSQLFIALRRKYVGESEFQSLYVAADELARMLSGLKTSVLSAKS
jgi:four helix bundle protein